MSAGHGDPAGGRHSGPGGPPPHGASRHPPESRRGVPPRPPEPAHRSLLVRRRLSPGALLPGLATLRHYRRGWLRGDVLAGVTVAAYLIPQVMAYAQIAGLPAAYGLYGVIGPALAYAVLGGSRRLSVGPESTTALMTATAVGAMVAGDGALGAAGATDATARYAALAAALAIVVGVVCAASWLLGLGFLADLLSKPVLVGYLAGAAVLMIISQIEKLTGIPAPGDSLPEQVLSAVHGATGHVHWPTLGFSLALLVVLFTAARLMPRAPNALLVVLLATAATAVLDLQSRGIRTIGVIDSSLPLPALPALSPQAVGQMLVPAIGVAIVAYSDNVLAGRAFARKDDPPIDANQELLALGAANVGAGLLGGFPVSSSASRTALGVAVGARTQAYMLVAAATVAVTVAYLGGVLALFPTAALGAIVVYAATRLVEWDEIRRIVRYRRSETVLMVATVLGVFFFGVLGGIGLAVGLSLLDLVRRVSRPHDGVLGYVPGLGGMHDVEDFTDARQVPGLVVYRYDSPLFFANAEDFRHRALAAVDAAPTTTTWLVVNAEANVETDLTALDALEELREELDRRGIVLALARVKHELHQDLDDHGVGLRIGADRMFATLPEAVTAYLRWYRDRHGRLPPGVEAMPRGSSPAVLDDRGPAGDVTGHPDAG